MKHLRTTAFRLRRRRLLAGAVAVLALLAAGPATGSAAPAEPDKPLFTSDNPDDGSNAAAKIMAAQLPLVDAADRVTALAGTEDTGLAGIELDVPQRALRVWWRGDPPEEIRAELERDSADGINVRLGTAEYSSRQLLDVARSIMDGREAYPGLIALGPRVDGSGLDLSIAEDADPDVVKRWVFKVPVAVTPAPAIAEMSRADDSPPWWAGAVTRSVLTSNRCSTGFAVHRTFLGIEISRGLLTAEHCSFGGDVDFVDGAGQFIGHAEPTPRGTSATHPDSLLIRTNSGARMFDGGVGVGEFSKPVVGRTGNYVGQMVCTSGAATGVHCDIRVTRINVLAFLTPSFAVAEGLTLATQQGGLTAVGPGDSGGPAFTLTADYSKVRAAGQIVGGTGAATPCPLPGQTGCLNQVAFVDINYVLIAHGADVVTS